MSNVVIVDSGGANIASLLYAFERLNCKAILSADAATIESADRVLLPGVGAAGDAMRRLRSNGLVEVIRNLTQPVLGICLGMQLLVERSEEEDVECLGVIPGVARRLDVAENFAVPNMGWCETSISSDHAVLQDIDDQSFFYYLHSYAIPVSAPTIATAEHSRRFSAMIAQDNFVAAQFHPERSSTAGAQLLRNFVGIAV